MKVHNKANRLVAVVLAAVALILITLMSIIPSGPVSAAPMSVGGTPTLFTPTLITTDGVTDTKTATDATDGMRFNNDGRTWLEINNANGSTITITFVTQATSGGLSVADKVVTQTTGTSKLYGPFSPRLYNYRTGTDAGRMLTQVSTSTNVSMTVFRLPALIE